MSLPDLDTVATYGGTLSDYSPVIDSTTDRPAAGANPAYANIAMATHTLIRAFARFVPAGTGAPALASSGTVYDAVWLAVTATAPVVARTTTGVYTLTWPTTVFDEIPAGAPGYNASGHTVNFRAGFANVEVGSTSIWMASVSCSANVVTVKIFNSSGSLADPNDSSVFGIFAV